MIKKRWTRQEKALLVVPLLLLMLGLLFLRPGDALNHKLQSLAGTDAVNCATSFDTTTTPLSRSDLKQIKACTKKAKDSGRTSYVRFNAQVWGSKTDMGRVHGKDGKVLVVKCSNSGLPFFWGTVQTQVEAIKSSSR